MRTLSSILVVAFVIGVAAPSALAFDTPEEAAEAFLEAWQDKDAEALIESLPPEAREEIEDDEEEAAELSLMLAIIDIDEFELGDLEVTELEGEF